MDSDCPCSTCDYHLSKCNPCNLTASQEALVNCFSANIPAKVESVARATWGITGVSHDVFIQTFINKTSSLQCITPSGEVTSDNQTTCLQLGVCRSGSVEKTTTQASCISGSFNGVCEICAENGACAELPFQPSCYVNDNYFTSEQYCTQGILPDPGYQYQEVEWNMFERICIYSTLSYNNCTCGTGLENNTLCLQGFCRDGTVLNESSCIYNPTTDPVMKSWDSTFNACIYQGIPFYSICGGISNGVWQFGRK